MQYDFNTIFSFKNKGIVIYNPHTISSIEIKAKEPSDDFRFIEGTKYLVTAGRLIGRKRVVEIIKAFSAIRLKGINTSLLILGAGEEEEALKKAASVSGFAEDIHFLGLVNNPFKFIARSELFIMASEREGLPNAIINRKVKK